MILIDAVFINDGGGKVLLDYIIAELEKTDKEIFYLLDIRVAKNIPKVKATNRVMFMKAGLYRRALFYKKYKKRFSTVLCLGNLPPNRKLEATVYTYFHQLLFLEVTREMSNIQKLRYWMKTRVLKQWSGNTDVWLVQTANVKRGLQKKYKVNPDNIMEMPFWPPLHDSGGIKREMGSYLYVSNGTSHKNHARLIEAFCIFYDVHRYGRLILTVDNSCASLLDLIEEAKKKYPVTNAGWVCRDKVSQLYRSAEFFVFPSFTESFGLGIVEAMEAGCKIIGSDLPYLHAVCEPTLVFDPGSVNSISEALSLSLREDLKPSVPKVRNNINELLLLLS